MDPMKTEDPAKGQRGPVDHSIREQIIIAANQHFLRFGYAKTTVSDLAAAIGFSKAYIYKFFDSKQAIGQAICSNCLQTIAAAADKSTADARSAADKLRLFFRAIIEASTSLYFDERELFEIAELTSTEKWPSWTSHCDKMLGKLRQILMEGRDAGEFERKTPLDEAARAIMQAMQPFMHPIMLRENLDRLPEVPTELINLILRSLSP
jgi:AcrR family transcriptional regulator